MENWFLYLIERAPSRLTLAVLGLGICWVLFWVWATTLTVFLGLILHRSRVRQHNYLLFREGLIYSQPLRRSRLRILQSGEKEDRNFQGFAESSFNFEKEN